MYLNMGRKKYKEEEILQKKRKIIKIFRKFP